MLNHAIEYPFPKAMLIEESIPKTNQLETVFIYSTYPPSLECIFKTVVEIASWVMASRAQEQEQEDFNVALLH